MMGVLYTLTSSSGNSTGAQGSPGSQTVETAARSARLLTSPKGLRPLLPLGDIAEHAFALLSPVEQDCAKEVMLRMIVPGDEQDDGRDTTRSVSLEELVDLAAPGRAVSMRRVLGVFTSAGLLTAMPGVIGVCSPALLVAWPRLRQWISVDREGLHIHRRLGRGARDWEAHARHDDALLHGSDLARCLEWSLIAPAHLRLNTAERTYLAASRRVRRRQRIQRRRWALSAAVLTLLTVATGTVAWNLNTLSEERRTRLEQEREQSSVRRAVSRADALRRSEPATAMLLNAAAWQIAPLEEARAGLLAAATQPERNTPSAQDYGDSSIWSHDGSTVAYVRRDSGLITVTDAATNHVSATFTPPRVAVAAAATTISANGSVLAYSGTAGVTLWRPRGKALPNKTYGTSHGIPLAVSDDGRNLVVREGDVLHVWDTLAGRRAARIPYANVEPSIALSRDGRRLAVCLAREAVQLWNTEVGRPVGRPLRQGTVVDDCHMRFSPDSRILGTAVELARDEAGVANGTGRIRLFDASSGAEKNTLAFDADTNLRAPRRVSFRFSPDSQYLAIAELQTLVIHDIENDATAARYALPVLDSVPDLQYGPDARTLHFASRSGMHTIAWRPKSRRHGTGSHQGSVFSPEGGRVAFLRESHGAGRRGTFVEVRDTTSGRVVAGPLPAAGPAPYKLSLSRDGRRLVVASGTTATVWDTHRQQRLAELRPVRTDLQSGAWHSISSGAVISPDGTHVATSSSRKLLLWTAASGHVGRTIPNVRGVPLAFTPDGALVVTDAGEMVDIRTGTVHAGFGENAAIKRVVASGNGKIIAAAEGGGDVHLWDVQHRRQIGTIKPDPEILIGSLAPATPDEVALSADGRTLATASVQGGPLDLWDTGTLRRIGDEILQSTRVSGITFTPRTGDLVVASDTGTSSNDPLLEGYALSPEATIKEICASAGRSLTPQEWRTHIPDLPYKKVCPG